MRRESSFQAKLIKEIKQRFPGVIVIKNDPNYIQGFPDLTILYGRRWAVLECKRCSTSERQPNQEYYVNYLDNMSYSRFISPENKEEILDELQQTFRA